MTRTVVPYAAPDLSALARLLERALADHQITHGRLPGHVEMMNLLARGAGKRNLQELQAEAARPAPAQAAAPPPPASTDFWFDAPELLDPATTPNLELATPRLSERAAKTLKCFDFIRLWWNLRNPTRLLSSRVQWTLLD